MKPFFRRGVTLVQHQVRVGFLAIMLAVTSVLGSSLWATIAVMPYLQSNPGVRHPSLHTLNLNSRLDVPTELAWFFVQCPYISKDAALRAKNHHTFILNDGPRKRDYVVTFGQNFRRVEIYFGEDKSRTQINVYSPGKKRTVEMRHSIITSDETKPDANLWMWQSPLWNSQHLKIYALADFWLDAPYKKFSCAGFVHQFLKDAGVNVPIQDAWDMARQPWTRVAVDELEPGDIITIRAASERHRRFWKHRITHVGVYLGNGKLIHASTASIKARRSYIRVATLDQFQGRVDKILRPPDML